VCRDRLQFAEPFLSNLMLWNLMVDGVRHAPRTSIPRKEKALIG